MSWEDGGVGSVDSLSNQVVGVRVVVGAGVVASPGLIGLVMLHGVVAHRIPLDVGFIGGKGVVEFERDFGVLGCDVDGDVTAREEVEVASNEVHRDSLFIILSVTVFVRTALGILALGDVIHFEVVERGG